MSAARMVVATFASSGGSGSPTVAAHTIKADANGSGTSPMTTPAVTTPATGLTILVQILAAPASVYSGLTDNMHNTYVQVGSSQAYANEGSGFIAGSLLFKCENAVGGPSHTWSLIKTSGNSYAEATMFVVVVTGASSVGVPSYTNNSKYGETASITTTAANSMVMSFWGPADYVSSNTYTPPAGWTKGDAFEHASNNTSGADAWKSVATSGTSVSSTWTASDSSRLLPSASLWLVEVKP